MGKCCLAVCARMQLVDSNNYTSQKHMGTRVAELQQQFRIQVKWLELAKSFQISDQNRKWNQIMINLKLMSKLHALTSNIRHIDIVGFHIPYFLLLFCNSYHLIKLCSLGRHQSILRLLESIIGMTFTQLIACTCMLKIQREE